MKADYFIYTGNAYPHKNLKRLIKAIILLNKNIDQKTKLKIVSSRNIFTQKLNKYILNSKAGNYIELLGFIDDKELIGLYRESIAFVFPSISEGFGLPGIEAIRAGTLLCASDIPIFREVYSEHAIYFDPLNINSIVEKLNQTIKIPDQERKNRINASQNFVKRYSWSKMAEQTIKIYEEAYKSEGSTCIRQS
jgi:glycosyltransferase involved in cell wall biosynthesis